MFLVKVCGITNLADALCAVDCGADYLGFVLYPPSPRAVGIADLAAMAAALPASVYRVGVFVAPARAEVDAAVAAGGLHAVQVHGPCRPDAYAGVGVPVWRALNTAGPDLAAAAAAWPAARYVVDAHAPGLYGGSGTLADWAAAAALARGRPVMLAGGLTPANVDAAVRAVRPLGVDVASGVEAGPGRKDPDKVRQFVRAARAAAAEIGEDARGKT